MKRSQPFTPRNKCRKQSHGSYTSDILRNKSATCWPPLANKHNASLLPRIPTSPDTFLRTRPNALWDGCHMLQFLCLPYNCLMPLFNPPFSEAGALPNALSIFVFLLPLSSRHLPKIDHLLHGLGLVMLCSKPAPPSARSRSFASRALCCSNLSAFLCSSSFCINQTSHSCSNGSYSSFHPSLHAQLRQLLTDPPALTFITAPSRAHRSHNAHQILESFQDLFLILTPFPQASQPLSERLSTSLRIQLSSPTNFFSRMPPSFT